MNHHHLLLAPSSLHARRTHYAASHLPPHLTPLVTIFTGRATGLLAINSQILIALQRAPSFSSAPQCPSFTISIPIQHCTRNCLSYSITKETSHPDYPSITTPISRSLPIIPSRCCLQSKTRSSLPIYNHPHVPPIRLSPLFRLFYL